MSKYLIEQVNPKYAEYVRTRRAQGKTSFAFCGGRRSGKTFFIAQFLTTRAYNGDIVSVASMTNTQGRLGAYKDFTDIIKNHPTLNEVFECLQSPMEIRNKANGGKIIFNSYQSPETAKGIACDWLFNNEANKFTKLQVADLRANVRKGWFIDYNPNETFWVDDYFKPDEICNSTWMDNPFLTPTQLEWFREIKDAAMKPDASPMDMWLYKVYYLGEYSELSGSIFTPENIHKTTTLPPLMKLCVFCDPSDMRGADYFAMVLGGTDGVNVYIIDTLSINVGNYDNVIDKLHEWQGKHNIERIYIETNGSIGKRFYEYARNSGIEAMQWWSKDEKFARITANYQDIVQRVIFHDTPANREYLQQVYAFDRKCLHDDNIDAVNSLLNYYKWGRLI